MSNAVTATGIRVKRNGTIVPGVIEVNPGGLGRNKIEVTTHNELTEAHKLGLLRSSSDPSFAMNLNGSNVVHQAIMDDLHNNVKNLWTILYPSGVSREGQAWVQQFEYAGAPVDSIQGVVVTLAWEKDVTENFS